MLNGLISQNSYMRCMVRLGTNAIEVIGNCLQHLEQQGSLNRVSADVSVKREKNDNIIVKIGSENSHGVTYETALKERFLGNKKMSLMQMPMNIELKKKGYSYEDENTKICFFEPSEAVNDQGDRVCYVNQKQIMQRLAAYKNMANSEVRSGNKAAPSSVNNNSPEKMAAK